MGRETGKEMEPNAAVEIHDSRIEQITSIGEDLVVFLDAYVHQSFGRPGEDAGTGWSQRLEVRFTKGRIRGNLDAMPIDLADGCLIASGETLDHLLQIPLDDVGPCKLELKCGNNASIEMEGEVVKAEFVGPVRYIKDFRP